MENQERKRYFQYIAGERRGEVVMFDRIEEEDGMVFICFKDESRCNEELILPLNHTTPGDNLMAEIDSPNNIWTFKEEWKGREEEIWSEPNDSPTGESHLVQPFREGRMEVHQIPPKRTTSNFGQITRHIETPTITQAPVNLVQQQAPNAQPPANTNDPVWLMMDKAKKFDTEVEMTLKVALPTKSLYNVAKESFDDGGNKIIEYIISNLDDKSLKDALKEALKVAYGDLDPEPEEVIVKGDDLFEPGEGGEIRDAAPDEVKEAIKKIKELEISHEVKEELKNGPE